MYVGGDEGLEVNSDMGKFNRKLHEMKGLCLFLSYLLYCNLLIPGTNKHAFSLTRLIVLRRFNCCRGCAPILLPLILAQVKDPFRSVFSPRALAYVWRANRKDSELYWAVR